MLHILVLAEGFRIVINLYNKLTAQRQMDSTLCIVYDGVIRTGSNAPFYKELGENGQI